MLRRLSEPAYVSSLQEPLSLFPDTARHRRFDPLYGLYRCALLHLGPLMEVLRTVVIVKHLTCLRKQGLALDARNAEMLTIFHPEK